MFLFRQLTSLSRDTCGGACPSERYVLRRDVNAEGAFLGAGVFVDREFPEEYGYLIEGGGLVSDLDRQLKLIDGD